MHQPHPRPVLLSEEQSAQQFWLRHAYLGVAVSAAAIVEITLYAMFANTGHRDGILLLALASAVVTTLAAVASPRVVRAKRRAVFFYLWSLGIISAVLTGAAIDGGDESPINATLFLPLFFAGLAYSPAGVLAVGFAAIGGYVAIAFADGSRSTSTGVVFAVTLALTTLMATRAARNRDVQHQQLQHLTGALEDMATHDPLTGCFNRRAFDDALEAEVTRAQRYGRPLSLLLVDVDRLKKINDDSGHEAGDAALRCVADALAGVGRRSDVIARLGGDEFAIVAPETEIHAAAEIAQRLHAALHAYVTGVPVTVSIGVAALGPGVPGGSELIRCTDLALYDAKGSGRDCTAIAEPAHIARHAIPTDPSPSGGLESIPQQQVQRRGVS